MASSKPLIAKVVLDTPLPQLDHLFDYEVPEDLRDLIRPGQRVRVPFRSRVKGITGYVIELATESDFAGKLQTVTEIISPVQLLQSNIWQLSRKLADRAGGNAFDILRLAIPPRQVRVENKYLKQNAAETQNSDANSANFSPKLKKLTDANSGANDISASENGMSALARELYSGTKIYLDSFAPPARLETGEWVNSWAVTFAQTAIDLFNAEKSSIIVVPDFRDIDQLHDTLLALDAKNVLRLDTRITNAERYLNFLKSLEHEPAIIIGNRSAVYAPAFDLGAIMVWDPADDSLVEPLAPYVHTRDAALIRSEEADVGLLFAANSRSVQMQRLIKLGYLTQFSLPRYTPKIVQASDVDSYEEQRGRIPAFVYQTIRRSLAEGPVLVQVWGPGFSPAMICSSCHKLARCPDCNGPYHSSRKAGVRCRLCFESARGWRCPECGGTELGTLGAGSEKTAEQLAASFQEIPVIISDGNHKRLRVDARPSLVIATRGAEPIASGGYRAVIILDVEKSLGSWHLHAAEDAIRRWRGAVSLAAPEAMNVIAGGGGPVVEALLKSDETDWINGELEDRYLLRYPPAVRIASLTGLESSVLSAIETVKNLPGVDVLGPNRIPDGDYRAIVRFEYNRGAEVAKILRAELLRQIGETAAKRYVQEKAREKRSKNRVSLRLKFDDETVFDEQGEVE